MDGGRGERKTEREAERDRERKYIIEIKIKSDPNDKIIFQTPLASR
jgi:hypothetical protein